MEIASPRRPIELRPPCRRLSPLQARSLAPRVLVKIGALGMAWSHIYSRLLYHIHIGSNFSRRARDIISNEHSRVCRRIASSPRYEASARSDFDVRVGLDVPSIDCTVRKRRLQYVARLACAKIPSPKILLQQRCSSGSMLPWVRLV